MIDVFVVTVDGPGGAPDLGIETRALRRIVAAAGWTRAAPIDVCAALGLTAREPSSRVAVVGGRDGERAIWLQGRVTLVHLGDGDVYPLPAAFRDVPYARAIRGISMPDSGPGRPLLVVDPELLVGEVAAP